jgi:hypothetical protein
VNVTSVRKRKRLPLTGRERQRLHKGRAFSYVLPIWRQRSVGVLSHPSFLRKLQGEVVENFQISSENRRGYPAFARSRKFSERKGKIAHSKIVSVVLNSKTRMVSPAAALGRRFRHASSSSFQSFSFTRRILPLLLSTQQRQNDM